MSISPAAVDLLAQEARALLTRLDRLRPFALLEPMVAAAGLFPNAQSAIERMLFQGRQESRELVNGFLAWLSGPGRLVTGAEVQRRFALLKLRFQAVLNEFDMFSDAITQRSERDNGPWLSGLDVVAADALALPGRYYELPPLICYLDRGPGASIRRARTRLPGGHDNPVAIVRVPRERMVGSGIGSSLVHEVGHQAAALLDLVPSLRPVLQGLQRGSRAESGLWTIWERWISEIVADFWSIARVGVAATLFDGRRQPPAAFRVSGRSRRSAPDAVVAGKAECRDGSGSLSPSAMGPAGGVMGRALSAVRSRRCAIRAAQASGSANAGLCGAAGQPSASTARRAILT